MYKSKRIEYPSWVSMKDRCLNKNSLAWGRYGGRGITICESWLDFWVFLKDMGDRPSKEYSLDRIDNDGNYEPGNCRWATRSEQQRNTKKNRVFEYKGKKYNSMAELAEKEDLQYDLLKSRSNKIDWSVEKMVEQNKYSHTRIRKHKFDIYLYKLCPK